ncbi:MAG: site-specific DNA-methyltransferase [Phycisphaerae bacterium]|nr:site-specific DNA-methyltransferase [Phycisphaerae bacterium]
MTRTNPSSLPAHSVGCPADRRHIEALYKRLVQEHRRANAAWRRIGDLTNDLLALGETYQQIQRRLGCSKTSLHRWAQIVQAFPSPDDSMLHGQPACMSVLNTCVTSARQLEGLRTDRWIPAAREALALVGKMRSIPSVRKLSAALARRRRERLDRAEAKSRSGHVFSADHALHQGDCVDVAKTLDDASVDMAWLDPCYFYGDEDGSEPKLIAMSPLVLTACANRTVADSKAVLRRLIPILARKLKPTGLVVLWSNGRSHDDPEIVELFLKHGWVSTQASLWRKWNGGSGPAGTMRAADAPDGERYIVWARKGHKPINHDPSAGRHGLIDDDQTRAAADTNDERFRFAADGVIDGSGLKHRGRRHLMEKPVALAERFFRKYLAHNGLVFDAFGCSGSACIAAVNLGHRFVYAELDEANFAFGSARIAAHVRTQRSPSS